MLPLMSSFPQPGPQRPDLHLWLSSFAEARPAEGGEQEGDGGDHGGQAPGLVEVRNLEAVGTGSGEAREPGEAGQEELPAQAAIGDPEPREEPQRAQRHLSTYSQLLLMEYVFQHTGYPSMALR